MTNHQVLDRNTLEQMSEEELAELILVGESAEKHEQKIQVYSPNPVQDRVHRSLAFIRALFSGNGVGKTTACIIEAIWTATGTHPHRVTARLPNTTIIVLDDSSKADTVYVAQLRKKRWYDISKLRLEKHGRSYTQEIIFPNGSNWIFMTHEMSEDKWESIEAAAVIFDEPPPRFILIALLRGQREKDMKPWIMFAGTPRGRYAPWMYREIYRPWKFKEPLAMEGATTIECFFGSTFDNLVNLDPDTIKRWEGFFDKKELATRIHGSFEFLSGRIFDTFVHELHVEKPFNWPRQWPCILAIDPHLRKNHVAVVLGIDPDKDVHVLCELETSLAGRRAAKFFIDAVDKFWIRNAICDSFGSIEQYEDQNSDTRKSFIKIFNEVAIQEKKRIALRATTNDEKKDDEWIEDMRDWLDPVPDTQGKFRPRFHVFETCVKTIDNFESYVWDEHTGRKADKSDPKEEPLGVNCDQLMCVKYGLALKPDKIGTARVIRRREVAGKAREYESHGAAKPWTKD